MHSDTLRAALCIPLVRSAVVLFDLVLSGAATISEASKLSGLSYTTATKYCKIAKVKSTPDALRRAQKKAGRKGVKGAYLTPEQKEKQREAARRRYEDPAEREKSRERAKKMWREKKAGKR